MNKFLLLICALLVVLSVNIQSQQAGVYAACPPDHVSLSGGSRCLTCEHVSRSLHAAMNTFLAGDTSHRVCKVDSDCTTVDPSTECSGTCPRAIAKKSKEAFLQLRTKLDEEYCTGDSNHRAVCGLMLPSCIVGKPVCSQRQCVLAMDPPEVHEIHPGQDMQVEFVPIDIEENGN